MAHPRRDVLCAVPVLCQAHRVHVPVLATLLHQVYAHPEPDAVVQGGGCVAPGGSAGKGAVAQEKEEKKNIQVYMVPAQVCSVLVCARICV